MSVFDATILWCWILFLVYWFASARAVKPAGKAVVGEGVMLLVTVLAPVF